MKLYLVVAAVFTVASAAEKKYTPPVAILKQIDKHNEDGSYSYGYEAADGTFKIETKYPDGEVYGKYGYIDDTGSLREVEYGASRRGFEPTGNEIQVAPPTLKSNSHAVARPLAPNEEDDGQYREDPGVYYKNDPYYEEPPPQRSYQQPTSRYTKPVYPEPEPEPEFDSFPSFRPEPSYRPQSQYRPAYRPEPAYRSEPAYRPEPAYEPEPYRPPYRPEPAYRPQPAYRPEPAYRPQPQPQPSYNRPSWNPQPTWSPPPQHNSYNPPAYNNNYGPSFQGHPAQNVDINSGSYTVNYKR